MNILGINSFFEHPAAALVVDGQLRYAAEDERFTRVKHGKKYSPYSSYLPYASIHSALKHCGLKAPDIDIVAVSYDRWKHLGASLLGCFRGRRLSSLREELSAWQAAGHLRRALVQNHELPRAYRSVWRPGDFARARYVEWDHHLAHAASAFFCSGFERSLIVVSDGSGESACTSVYLGDGGRLERIDSVGLPNSLGFFYSFVTAHLGFEPFSDEYKVMGLAAYGEPRWMDEMRQLVELLPGGRYRIDIGKLRALESLLGPVREAGDSLTDTHKDIARSLQIRLEEALAHVVRHHLDALGERNLCVAGGTFLNCVANAKLARLEGVEGFFVQPAAHDAGTAIGAAALSCVAAGGGPQIRYESMLLGPAYTDLDIERVLNEARLPYQKFDRAGLVEEVADRLSREEVVAYFQGRMEFGPRALGARSFLASPRSARTRERLNIIKGREQFRPLAPLVTEDAYDRFFDGVPNRYMMLAVTAREETARLAPAVVHADGTSRAQMVRRADDELLYDLLVAFESRSGIPILINTSLNVRGRPIDATPVEALGSALCSGVDTLVIGSFVVPLGQARTA